MGRKRRKSTAERDNNNIASNKLLSRASHSLLSELEDLRTFYPSPVRPARGFFRDAASIGIKPVRRNVSKQIGGKYVPDVFKFNAPRSVAVCVRRRRRKEVLFATKRTGKGSRARRKRNAFSDVSCQ